MESVPSSEQSAQKNNIGSLMAGAQGLGGSTTTSLLILHQLEDKQMALDCYFGFLKEVGLWNRVRYLILIIIKYFLKF